MHEHIILSDYRHITIIGSQNSGKSTFLEKLTTGAVSTTFIGGKRLEKCKIKHTEIVSWDIEDNDNFTVRNDADLIIVIINGCDS